MHKFKGIFGACHCLIGHDGYDEARRETRQGSALFAWCRLLDEIDTGSFERCDA